MKNNEHSQLKRNILFIDPFVEMMQIFQDSCSVSLKVEASKFFGQLVPSEVTTSREEYMDYDEEEEEEEEVQYQQEGEEEEEEEESADEDDIEVDEEDEEEEEEEEEEGYSNMSPQQLAMVQTLLARKESLFKENQTILQQNQKTEAVISQLQWILQNVQQQKNSQQVGGCL